MNKQAMIFAAGLGTRLKPLTDSMPKALVEINGTAMLDHIISTLVRNGFGRIIINVHHFADMIVNHLSKHGPYGADIVVSDEREMLLDTAGGIRKAVDFIIPDRPLLIHNADILTDIDLSSIYNSIDGVDASLLCSSERNTSRYLLFNKDRLLSGWINKTTGETRPDDLDYANLIPMAFGGIHVISPRMIAKIKASISADRPSPIIPFYIQICHEYKIQAYVPSYKYQWFDIGNLDKLNQARTTFIPV
ncbi:MAG: sugar phosphate nucleotidyltransferase [Muribaculum sp.]|nr:sugar phosphate nucleotidyltransferase [Muribaculum sp.]